MLVGEDIEVGPGLFMEESSQGKVDAEVHLGAVSAQISSFEKYSKGEAQLVGKTLIERQFLLAAACGNINRITKFLDKEPYIVHTTDQIWGSALHFAIKRKDINLAKILLARGHPATVSNKHGITPLHLAYELESKELIDLLLEHKASKVVPSVDGLRPSAMTPLSEQYKTAGTPAGFDGSLIVSSSQEALPIRMLQRALEPTKRMESLKFNTKRK